MIYIYVVIILYDNYQLPLPADWYITVTQHTQLTAQCVLKQPQVLTNDSYYIKCKTRQNQGKI